MLNGNSVAGMSAGIAIYDFGRLGDVDLKNFILKRFRLEQVGISIRLMDDFIERTGYAEKDSEADLYKIDGDAVKTAVFVKSEGRSEVAPGDIETCIPPEIGTDVFKMLDALSAGKKAEAVTLLASALALGENAFRLTNLLIGHFEILFACKEMKALGYSIQKMADILSQKSTFRVKKLAPYTDRFTSDRLAAILTRLYSVEKEIRVGNIKEELALITFFADA
jgi:DNA polymerase III delta subunit